MSSAKQRQCRRDNKAKPSRQRDQAIGTTRPCHPDEKAKPSRQQGHAIGTIKPSHRDNKAKSSGQQDHAIETTKPSHRDNEIKSSRQQGQAIEIIKPCYRDSRPMPSMPRARVVGRDGHKIVIRLKETDASVKRSKRRPRRPQDFPHNIPYPRARSLISEPMRTVSLLGSLTTILVRLVAPRSWRRMGNA